ncbi:MAG: uL15 family ribosomal protein [Thermoplasmata archaeon]|nr:uL15 family ribosomal protein [Thermoplasmata archaeon]
MSRTCERHRGSRTHGRGKKAGRGAGKRGGRGQAGLHKHKYITTVKYHPDYFGRHGMNRDPSLYNIPETMNVGALMENLDSFVADGKAGKKDGTVTVNLKNLGIDKLLGTGKANTKVVVMVDEATEKAVKKIEDAGGEVKILQEDKPAKAPAKKKDKK